jgi:hypothetical protein
LLSTLYASGWDEANGPSHIYKVEDYASSPRAVDVGSSGVHLNDLAIDPLNDAAYAISLAASSLYSVNLNTGQATRIGALGAPGMDALTFSSTGTLYAMSIDTTDLYTVNVATGQATVVFDTGFKSQGDLAFETDGSLYLAGLADLVKIDLSNDTATAIGPFGAPDFVGLAVDSSGQMYGTESVGSTAIMFRINTTTGAATEIGVVAGASSLGVSGLSFDYPSSPLPTLTALTASTTSAALGQSVTFTATVSDLSPGGATPNGGTVTFSDQDGTLGTAPLVNGVATFTTSSLTAGTYTVSASYGGTTDFAPSSTGTSVTVIITPGGPIGGTVRTRTVLTAQPRPANLGRPVTLTATVRSRRHGGGTPGGSVTFLDGTADLGTVPLQHGKARLKTSSLPPGPNFIQADYKPSQGFAPSTAAIVEIVRTHRSRSRAATSAKTGRQAVRAMSGVIRLSEVAAIPAGALTIVGEPDVLGPLGPDQETAAHRDGIPEGTHFIRTGLWSRDADGA